MRNLLLMILMLLPAMAHAAVPGVPDAQKRGTARMSVLLWNVYDATLFTPQAAAFSFDAPFALKLDYLMELEGDDIAQRSVEEMRDLGVNDEVKLAAWYSQMRSLFPDVQKDDSLTGIYKPNEATIFYQGETMLGQIRDPEFGRWFFGIWLRENTSDATFRRKLLEEAQ